MSVLVITELHAKRGRTEDAIARFGKSIRPLVMHSCDGVGFS